MASKGIEASTGQFLNEIYEEFVPSKNIGFISGPSFAAEVIKGLPAAIVINSKSKKLYDEFSPFFPKFLKLTTLKMLLVQKLQVLIKMY